MCVTCILLFTFSLAHIESPYYTENNNPSFSPASNPFCVNLLTDPDFSNTPNIELLGLSEEFSWNHDADFEDDDFYVELTWSHVPGTELSIAGERELIHEQNDLILFSQSFEWTYDFHPNAAKGFMEYSITTSGNFSINEEAEEMFEVYWWLIDSSGNWELIYYSPPPYHADATSIDVDLDYFDLEAGWFGMIEDENGEQEDPTDILKIAFGLAPTDSFRLYNTSEPWREYSGVVSVRFYSAYLVAFADTQSDPSEFIQPTFNNSYNTPASEILPDYPEVEDHSLDDVLETAEIGSDNTVYTIGTTYYGSTSPIYASQVLIKWNPETGIEWVRRYGNRTWGDDVSVDGYSIYTTGAQYREGVNSLLVIKYDSFGSIIWEKTYYSESFISFSKIRASPEGSIFVAYVFYNHSASNYFLNLMRLDGSGEFVAQNQIPEVRIRDMKVDSGGNVFVLTYDALYKFDVNCSLLWNNSAWNLDDFVTAIDLSANDDLYTASQTIVPETGGHFTTFRKWESVDTLSWETVYNLDYGYGYQDWAECYYFDVAPDSSLFALLEELRYSSQFELIKLGSNGTKEWNHTIGDHTWPLPNYGDTIPIKAGTNGLLYIAYSKYNTGEGMSSGLDAYDCVTAYPFDPVISQQVFTFISQTITVGSISVILIVILLFIQERRRPSHLAVG